MPQLCGKEQSVLSCVTDVFYVRKIRDANFFYVRVILGKQDSSK